MDKQTYMKKFSRIVRWRLQKTEADEVLSDYEEMLLYRSEDDNDTLLQELGNPFQAARMLTEPRAYSCWLAVFFLMAACLLLPEVMLLRTTFNWIPSGWFPCFLIVGTVVALIWFRPRKGTEKPPLPKGLLLSILAPLLGLFVAGGVIWGLAIEVWEWVPLGMYGSVARWSLSIVGSVSTVAAFCGLIQSRLSNYRWRALYIMGLTVLIECAIVMALLTGMDLHGAYWWMPYAISFSITGICGLIGTGVSLC